jgi:hypothetical protein
MVENILHRPVEALYQNTGGAQMLFQMCYDHMKKKLAKKPEIFEQMVPDFPPGCKRLTPGPGVSGTFDFLVLYGPATDRL